MSNTTEFWVSLLVGIIFLYLGYFEISKKYNAYRLKKYGLRVIANVTAISETGFSVDYDSYSTPILELRLAFESPQNVTRTETIRYAFNKWQKIPIPGDKIFILVDKENPQHFALYERYL